MKGFKYKRIRPLAVVTAVILLCFFSGCGKNFLNTGHPENTDMQQNPGLEVHFIDVGQGDSTLLIYKEHAMLIDAGEDSQGTNLQNYLEKQGVKKLDYVVATHPDADHIGGLDVILTKFDCGIIFFPDAQSDTVAYRDVTDAIKYRGYEVTRPEMGAVYSLGDAAFTIIVSENCPEENNNNASIGLKMTYGKNSFLFTGDAEKEALTDMLQSGADLRADVLKAGHHGSSDSADELFLETVGAKYAVISCGKGNDYGHPHAKTLNLFKKLDMQVFRTDEQGSVTAFSNGEEITWSHTPSETWEAGVYKGSQDSIYTENHKEDEDSWINNAAYILNTGSYKFHRPECESVADMSRRNKKGTNLTREEIINLGYVPCNRCKP